MQPQRNGQLTQVSASRHQRMNEPELLSVSTMTNLEIKQAAIGQASVPKQIFF